MLRSFLASICCGAALSVAAGCSGKSSHSAPPPPLPPLITDVVPPTGSTAGGTLVTVYGKRFGSITKVQFDGNDATAVQNLSQGNAVESVTPSGSAGAVDVLVRRGDGYKRTLTGGFTYVSGASSPSIGSVSPTQGPAGGGNTVTISGSGFTTSGTVLVWFGATAATGVTVNSSSQIVVTAPAGTPATTVSVALANPDGGSTTLSGAYQYVISPLIYGVNPAVGLAAGGDTITITGDNFQAGATVTLGGAQLTNVAITAKKIIGDTPAHAVGDVDVRVTNPDTYWGEVTNGFRYTATPSVSAVNPSWSDISGGITITITGTDFAPGATADLQGTNLTNVTVVSSTEIHADIPAHAPAELDVTVTNVLSLSSTLTDGFYYGNVNNFQRASYSWDTSTGIDRTKRWLIETNWASFRTDLANRGLQTATASDAVNEYVVDWMAAYICQGVNIHYGRNGDGTKVSGSSINVTFVLIPPGSGSPGGGGTNDYSRMCIGGTSSSGSGVLGTAWMDSGNPCGNSSEDDCTGAPYGGSGSTLGVFTASISKPSPSTLSPALSPSDQKYLDGSVTSGTRYTQLHDFMVKWCWRIAYVCSHEIGHSCGLVGSALTGSCSSQGQCSATGGHNNCCTANIMRSSVSYSGITGFASRAFSGMPGGPTSGSSCYSSTLSSWAMLQSYLGTSP